MPAIPKTVTFSPLTVDGQTFPWYIFENGVTYYPPNLGSDGRLISMGRLVVEIIVDENTQLSNVGGA